jgi:DNA-binding NtrC family response regulator
MDGLELLRHMRQLRPLLPVVLMSGDASVEPGAWAGDALVERLQKPFTAGPLTEAVRRALARRSAT